MSDCVLSKLHADSFKSEEERLYVSMVYISERLQYRAEKMLKQNGMTQTQYNALRILRGAGGEGMACNQIGARMLNRVPDITRLLDRLEKLAYLTRERQKDNRRVVKATITRAGLKMVNDVEEPLLAFHADTFKGVSEEDREHLLKVLDSVCKAACKE